MNILKAFDEGEGFDEGQDGARSSSTSIHHADSSGTYDRYNSNWMLHLILMYSNKVILAAG